MSKKFTKKFVKKICQTIHLKNHQTIQQKNRQRNLKNSENTDSDKSGQKRRKSRFLEAPLVRQADGELKNMLDATIPQFLQWGHHAWKNNSIIDRPHCTYSHKHAHTTQFLVR